MLGIAANTANIFPAALTLFALRAGDSHLCAVAVLRAFGQTLSGNQMKLGNDAQIRKRFLGEVPREIAERVLAELDRYAGFQRLADGLLAAGRFERAVDLVAQGQQAVLLLLLRIVERIRRIGRGHIIQQDIAQVVPFLVRHRLPLPIRGKAQDG